MPEAPNKHNSADDLSQVGKYWIWKCYFMMRKFFVCSIMILNIFLKLQGSVELVKTSEIFEKLMNIVYKKTPVF